MLTATQVVALRAACFADPTAAAFFTGAGDAAGLQTYLNGPSGANAWRTDASINAVLDAINWSLYTPTDIVASAEPLLTQQVARLLTIQTKQMNLQLMLQGREILNCARPNVRGGLRDAVIQIPSGVSGANTSPGGSNGATVLAQCVRSANRAEVMLAAQSQASNTTGTTTARVLTWEGSVEPFEAAGLIYHDNGTLWTAQG